MTNHNADLISPDIAVTSQSEKSFSSADQSQCRSSRGARSSEDPFIIHDQQELRAEPLAAVSEPIAVEFPGGINPANMAVCEYDTAIDAA